MRHELRKAFERFTAMQEAHRQALREGRLAECMAWRGRREVAFRKLQQCLASLGDLAGLPDKELAAAVQMELGRVMAGERQLAEAVRERQMEIEKQRGAMRRGKQLLGKLGATHGGGPGISPRFLSNRA